MEVKDAMTVIAATAGSVTTRHYAHEDLSAEVRVRWQAVVERVLAGDDPFTVKREDIDELEGRVLAKGFGGPLPCAWRASPLRGGPCMVAILLRGVTNDHRGPRVAVCNSRVHGDTEKRCLSPDRYQLLNALSAPFGAACCRRVLSLLLSLAACGHPFRNTLSPQKRATSTRLQIMTRLRGRSSPTLKRMTYLS
jgi:hypothetical protein